MSENWTQCRYSRQWDGTNLEIAELGALIDFFCLGVLLATGYWLFAGFLWAIDLFYY